MGLLRNLFGKKSDAAPGGGTSEKLPPSGSIPEQGRSEAGRKKADLGQLVDGLGRYEFSLKALVGELESGGSRAAMNAELQRLFDFDLGRMIYSAPEFENADGPRLESLRVVLKRIKAAAEKAGGHIEGGARPPTSLQGVLDEAIAGAQETTGMPPALRMIIPNILMITKSTLERISELEAHSAEKPTATEPGIGKKEPDARPSQYPLMDADEFDRLARDCCVKMRRWYLHSVMTIAGGGPPEKINKLRKHIDSFASGAPQISEAMLENIRQLDDRLHLGGRVITLCREASEQFARFRQTVDGTDWQQALKKSHNAAEALEETRKKLFGSGFGSISVNITP